MHKAKQELSYSSILNYRSVLGGLLLAAAIGSTIYDIDRGIDLYQQYYSTVQDTQNTIQEQKRSTKDRSTYEVANSGDTVRDKTRVLKGVNLTATYSVPNKEELGDIKFPAIRVKFSLNDPELIAALKEAEGTLELQSKLKQTTMYGSRAPSFRKGKFYPYRDPHGNYTIGYGHLISKTRSKVPLKFSNGITKQAAEELLRSDMERVYGDFVLLLQKRRATNLPREVQMALFEMTFNMGTGGVDNFNRMWSKLRKGQFQHASKELKNSAWSKQIQKDRFTRLTAMISMQ